MSGHLFIQNWLFEADGVFGGISEGVVNRTVVYLIIDAVCPVVVCDITILGVYVTINIEVTPYVPHHIPLVRAGGVVFCVF